MVTLQHQRVFGRFSYFHSRARRTIDGNVFLHLDAIVDHPQESGVLDLPSACVEPRRAEPDLE
jgi:hypothetical protein